MVQRYKAQWESKYNTAKKKYLSRLIESEIIDYGGGGDGNLLI